MTDEVMEQFKEIVREIDRVSKRGDHRQTLAMLPQLLAVESGDALYSKKKSHFLAALAFRALQGGEAATAIEFLELADRGIPDEHMTPFLRGERANIRKASTEAPSPTRSA